MDSPGSWTWLKKYTDQKMKYSALRLIIFFVSVGLLPFCNIHAQSAMINVNARKTISLDGDWRIIIDPVRCG